MKLNNEFITREMDNQQFMISASGKFSGLVRSNKTAAFIVDCLANDTTEDEIVQKMLAKYNAPEDIIRKDVKKILDTLRRIGEGGRVIDLASGDNFPEGAGVTKLGGIPGIMYPVSAGRIYAAAAVRYEGGDAS